MNNLYDVYTFANHLCGVIALIAFIIFCVTIVGEQGNKAVISFLIGVIFIVGTLFTGNQEEKALYSLIEKNDYAIYYNGESLSADTVDVLQFDVDVNHDEKAIYLTEKETYVFVPFFLMR